MKNDPGLQEEKKIPELPKPSWFQVAGDVDDFIFYYETKKHAANGSLVQQKIPEITPGFFVGITNRKCALVSWHQTVAW